MLRTIRHIKTGAFVITLVAGCLWADAQVRPPAKKPATPGRLTVKTGTTDTSILVKRRQLEQAATVTGIIREAATGKPLNGINVRYKDFSAAISDSTGSFSLKVPDYLVSVTVEGQGYQSKEVALKGRSRIEASLYEDTYTSFYDEVVLPSGKLAKNQVPYAVASIQTESAWNRPFETPDTYLQGKVAGLNVMQRSGTPNAGANLFLRGYSSLNATAQPLVVVDGIIYDNTNYGSSLIPGNYINPLSYIDIKDVDNITVIKDGTSIYGTKGSNGVIMITTARARELATRIDFAMYGSMNFVPEKIPLLNAAQYRNYVASLLQTSGLTAAQIQAQPYMTDSVSNPEYYRYHNNTDWQKQVMDKSFSQNFFLKVTGGDNIAKYALSLGYMKNPGIVTNTNVLKYNTRFNADLLLSKRLTATTSLSFTFYDQQLKDGGVAAKTNPLYVALIKSPLVSPYQIADNGAQSPALADKDTFNVSNPTSLIQVAQALSKSYRFFGSLGFNYNITKSLALSTVFSLTKDEVRESYFVPRRGVVDDTLSNAVADSRTGAATKRLFTLYNDTRLSFNKSFNRIHQLSARLGLRYQRSKSEQDLLLGANTPVDELKSVGNGLAALRRTSGDIGEWRWINNYLGADYNLLDRYFISFNMAVDGSSRFGSTINSEALRLGNHRFAVMPSLAAGWLLSSEKFMSGSSFIDLLKIRASIGLSGNDDIGNYNNRQYYISQNLLGVQGLVRGDFGNPDIQWEKVRKLNAGFDLALLNERITIAADVYNNHNSKLIINEPTAAATGLLYAVTNTGASKTKGVELAVTGRIINKKWLKWDVGATVSRYKTTITGLPVSNVLYSFNGATIINQPGVEPGSFYGFKTAGVYTTDAEAAQAGNYIKKSTGELVAFKGGDVRFVDTNGDHLIDDKDRTVIGNPNPDFFGGITNHLEYKRWSLDAVASFTRGADTYNYIRNQLEAVSALNNQTLAVINRWRNNGDVTDIPKATFGDPIGNSRFSDRWIEDGSFFRLRSVSLSYNWPINSKFFKYLVVYAVGNNVVTLTRYKGYDPEISATAGVLGQGVDTGLEPVHRSVQAGLRIGL